MLYDYIISLLHGSAFQSSMDNIFKKLINLFYFPGNDPAASCPARPDTLMGVNINSFCTFLNNKPK